MKRFDDDELGAALRELRPTPSPEFNDELDERAAAGFPRRRSDGLSPLTRLRAWLGGRKPRQLLLPAVGVALTAVAVATVLVISGEGGGHKSDSGGGLTFLSQTGSSEGSANLTKPDRAILHAQSNAPSDVRPSHGSSSSAAGGASSGAEEATETEGGATSFKYDKAVPSAGAASGTAGPLVEAAPKQTERKVERSAEIEISTEKDEVSSASTKVFEAVHAYDGIVLDSSTKDGSGVSAEAKFELLIPSAKLGDAMAALSRIGEVRSRRQATDDITAPTVSAEEKLQDSEARVDSLLKQLREAGDEGERELVEAELSSERRHAAHLKGQLDDLGKRASLSRVEARIVSDANAPSPAGSDEGKWGVGDALHSAGRVLAVAAGVAIVGAAVLVPIALLLLLAWLASRAWTRRSRERALS